VDPTFLESWLIGGGKVVSLTHVQHFISKNFFCFWYSFLLEVVEGRVRLEALGSLNKIHSKHRKSSTPAATLSLYCGLITLIGEFHGKNLRDTQM
jgi:hypothetical protein